MNTFKLCECLLPWPSIMIADNIHSQNPGVYLLNTKKKNRIQILIHACYTRAQIALTHSFSINVVFERLEWKEIAAFFRIYFFFFCHFSVYLDAKHFCVNRITVGHLLWRQFAWAKCVQMSRKWKKILFCIKFHFESISYKWTTNLHSLKINFLQLK